jgi:phosphoglycerate dehydrogenase-like enzyme
MAAVPPPISMPAMVDEPPTPLRVHFSDVVDKNYPELRPRFVDLLPTFGGANAIVISHGGSVCPADAHICVAKGPAVTPEYLGVALESGALKAVVLPHAGIPPGATKTLLLPEFSAVRLFNLHHNATPTAEVAITLMLAASRRLVPADRWMRVGSWEGKEVAAMGAVQCGLGGVALVLGFGEVGKVVAAVCKALGMTVITMRRSATEIGVTPEGYELHPPGRASLHMLLPRATHLIVTCPLTEETRGLISHEELALLPKQAVVVNVGRAEVVDEGAMWVALQRDFGTRLAFGSDVWWSESLPTKAVKPGTMDPPAPSRAADISPGGGLFGCCKGGGSDKPNGALVVFPSQHPMHQLDNVVMTPHFGGGHGLPNVEPARTAALVALVGKIVVTRRWPQGANVEIGY